MIAIELQVNYYVVQKYDWSVSAISKGLMLLIVSASELSVMNRSVKFP